MDHSGSIFSVEEIELVFPKFNNEDKMTESEICMKCHGCCTYVAVPLQYPRSRDTVDTYVWYLLHRNVEIEIDNYDKWFLVFKTPCDKLLPNGACSIYETRPQICRDYSADNCSRTAKDHKYQFKKPEDMFQFLNEKKAKSLRTQKKPAKARSGSRTSPIHSSSRPVRGSARKSKVRA